MREPIEIAVEARRYVLRQPTIADLSNYKRAVRKAGGKSVALGDKLLLIESGLKAMAAGAGREDPAISEALGLVGEAKSKLMTFVGDVQAGAFEGADSADMVAAADEALQWDADLQHIAGVVERHYPPYADALADAEVYPEIAGRVALEMFLESAEGLAAPMRQSMGRLATETLEAVPSSDLPVIHTRFQAELQLAEAEKKGLASRTSGDADQSNSEASSTARRTPRSGRGKRSTSAASSSVSSPSTLNGQHSPATTN